MFRILSIVLIIGSLIWLYIFLNKNKLSFSKIIINYFISLGKSLGNLKHLRTQNLASNLDLIKRIIYLFTLLLFITMTLAAFIPIILFNTSLSGFFLLIHVSLAPLFSVFLAILVILYAHSNRFDKHDLVNSSEKAIWEKFSGLNLKGYTKLIFWLIALFSIPAMISIILSMFPLFGTEGQLNLLKMHRISTLACLLLVIVHSGLISVQSE